MTIVTIQSGDSLYSIAKRFGVSIDQLVAANGIDPHRYLVIGDSLIIPAPEEPEKKLWVNGFAYPFIDRKTLQKTLPYLTSLSIFSYGLEEDGDLEEPEGDRPLIRMAKEAGVAPLLVLTTVDESGGFNARKAAALLENKGAWAHLAEELKETIAEKGYYGINVDLEYIPAALGQAYIDLIAYLKEKLAPHPVWVSLAPKSSSDQQGPLYEGLRYRGLGEAADAATVMTYEWGHTFGPPMAVSPIEQVDQVLRYALTEIPAEKLLMGLPNYGYDWRLPYEKGYPARSVGNHEAVALARKYGARILYDETAQAPNFRYYDRHGSQHEVWYEDARSYQAKLALAQKYDLFGISIWNIMRFYQPLYTLLKGSFDIVKIDKNDL